MCIIGAFFKLFLRRKSLFLLLLLSPSFSAGSGSLHGCLPPCFVFVVFCISFNVFSHASRPMAKMSPGLNKVQYLTGYAFSLPQCNHRLLFKRFLPGMITLEFGLIKKPFSFNLQWEPAVSRMCQGSRVTFFFCACWWLTGRFVERDSLTHCSCWVCLDTSTAWGVPSLTYCLHINCFRGVVGVKGICTFSLSRWSDCCEFCR